MEKILSLCKKPKKIIELMEIFSWKDRTKFKDKFIVPLIEEKLIEMTDPENPTNPYQKYVITAKGKKLLEQ